MRLLAQHPEGLTSGAVERELNASFQTVFRHLQALEAAGVVVTNTEEPRIGRRVEYQLDQAALVATLRDYEAYLLGK